MGDCAVRLSCPREAFHSTGDWHILSPTDSGRRSACYLIARKKQSPAEWANAQPGLAALARFLESDSHLCLYQSGSHEMGRDCPEIILRGFTGPDGSRIEIQNGKWKDTP